MSNHESPLYEQPESGPAFGVGWPAIALFGLLAVALMKILVIPGIKSTSLFAQSQPALPREVAPSGGLSSSELDTVNLFQKCSKSVVFIKSSVVRSNPFSRNLLERPQGTGSGFVWDKEGHIVTNFHVVSKADRAQVILPDQSTWEARAVGYAQGKDLAILKIEAPSSALHPIPIGSSGDLEVGQQALAIGSPFGLDQTLTTGVISGLDREITSPSGRRISDVIQTDAAINPGNSGGPLLDSSGRLIGVNTAIVSPSGAYAGIGFAIPVDTVNRLVPQLIEYGQVVHPWLGISWTDPRRLAQVGIDVEGVHVREVVSGGPAEKGGIRANASIGDTGFQLGDFIVQMDEKPIKSTDDLFDFLETAKVDQRVKIKILRPELSEGSDDLNLSEMEVFVDLAKDLN